MNKRSKLTLEDVMALAKEKGGVCLSKKYVNVNKPLFWKCKNRAHPKWEMSTNNLLKGSWCPQCRLDKYIYPLRAKIKEYRGKWISGEYKNSYTKITVQCENKHEWKAKPAAIILGHWCARCAHDRKKQKTAESLHKMVLLKNGVVVSHYNGGSTGVVVIKCRNGHTFKTSQSKISQGHWCPLCARDLRFSDFNELKKIVRSRGGKCLSEEYKGAHYKLQFQCRNNHTWSAKPNAIKNGTWCPVCKIPVGENLVRMLLEEVFESPFPKSYPKWLKSNEGTQLELDGYNKDLRIAFEHQGIQHLRPKGFYISQFVRRQELDSIKRDLCKRHGVHLIEIFQAGEKRSLAEIKNDLLAECRRLSIRLPKSLSSIDLQREHAYRTGTDQIHGIIKSIAASKGGRCISNTYGGHYYKLEFECGKKHRWFTDPATIKRGRWCPACAKQNRPAVKPKYNLGDMIALAKHKGGKCLSTSFVNITTKLKWECKNGHSWESVPSSVLRGCWCKSCAATERNLKRYNK